jgi:hypothetical protein
VGVRVGKLLHDAAGDSVCAVVGKREEREKKKR